MNHFLIIDEKRILCMKRVVIIGLPGSGKSTFAIELGEKLNIPVHHLDKFYTVLKELI